MIIIQMMYMETVPIAVGDHIFAPYKQGKVLICLVSAASIPLSVTGPHCPPRMNFLPRLFFRRHGQGAQQAVYSFKLTQA